MRLAGLDIGTTGAKAVVIDESGNLLAQATRDYPLLTPRPGWTEQNPDEWWRAAQECLAEVAPFDALGLTGQMHGAVFLDAAGEVIRPALLWNDQRTEAEVRQIEEVLGTERVMRITCNPPLTGFQAPKILWLKNNEPDNFARLSKVLLPKDYIRYRLSGEFFTEVSDASGTGLFDVRSRRWSDELIEGLGLRRDLFPECAESDEATTKTDGIPIVGGGGDQAAGAVGTGAVVPEVVSVSLGTSGVVFASRETPDYDPDGRVHTFCHANRKWHSMGVMLSCGGALRWARDIFGFGSYDEMASLAVPAKDSRIVFKPYLAGERTPHNDPNLRASFEGLGLSDGRPEIAKAIFKGITDGLHDGYRILMQGRKAGMLRITGGGAKSDFWMRLLAYTFQTPCARMGVDEGPAYGAAILAGVGVGLWPDVITACGEVIRLTDWFDP